MLLSDNIPIDVYEFRAFVVFISHEQFCIVCFLSMPSKGLSDAVIAVSI